jgi:hypothetical protein
MLGDPLMNRTADGRWSIWRLPKRSHKFNANTSRQLLPPKTHGTTIGHSRTNLEKSVVLGVTLAEIQGTTPKLL